MSRDILLADIDRDPEQPRTHFDEAALQELADSMNATGQAVPITVKPAGARYTIVQGERRWRAAQLLGWATIRAEVQDLDAATAMWRTLVENIQRADLTPIEEAVAYQKLVDAGHTQTEIARRIGKTQSYVAQKLRLLRLPAEVQQMLQPADATAARLTEGHARQILRLAYPGYETDRYMVQIAVQALEHGWSVRRLKLDIDLQQMTHDGYWLLPIDDHWRFADLVELEKTFAEDGATPDGPRRMQVMQKMGIILRWSEQIWNAGAPGLATAMLEEFPLTAVYWWTRQCAEWDLKYASDVDLPAYLRYAWAWTAGPEAKERTRAMLADLSDADLDHQEIVRAGIIGVILGIDRDFERIFAECVSQETPIA